LKDEQINIRIAPKVKADLKAIADKHGLKLSELLNLKIKQLIENDKLGIVDKDIGSLAYNKMMKKGFKFKNIKTVYHY